MGSTGQVVKRAGTQSPSSGHLEQREGCVRVPQGKGRKEALTNRRAEQEQIPLKKRRAGAASVAFLKQGSSASSLGAEGAVRPCTPLWECPGTAGALATRCTSVGGTREGDHSAPGRNAEQALEDPATGTHQDLLAQLHVCPGRFLGSRAHVVLEFGCVTSLLFQGFGEKAEGDAQGWSAQGSVTAGESKRGGLVPLYPLILQSIGSNPFPGAGFQMHGTVSEPWP